MSAKDSNQGHLLYQLFAAAIREVCPGVTVDGPSSADEGPELPWCEVTVNGLRDPLWLAADQEAKLLFSLEPVSLPESPLLRRFISRVAKSANRTLSIVSASTGLPSEEATRFHFLVTCPDGKQVRVSLAIDAGLANVLSVPAEIPLPAPQVDSAGLGILMDMQLPVSICVGRAHLSLGEALELTDGSVVELEASENELVEILVNRTVVARGELVVVDGNYGVRIQDIVSGQGRVDLAAELARVSQGATRVN